MACTATSNICSVLDNVTACTSVLSATTRVLAKLQEKKKRDCTAIKLSAMSSTESLLGSAKFCEEAVCHACVLDVKNGLWTLASAQENGQRVLMAIKSSLSKHACLAERMCMYRMELPSILLDECCKSGAATDRSPWILPSVKPDKLSLDERLARIKEQSAKLDKWYDDGGEQQSFSDVFTSDVQILRHVTNPESGVRETKLLRGDTVSEQTPSTFGQRRKHVLSEVSDPENYVTYVQSYEISVDSNQQAWRQSSIRIRIFDPNDGYRLRLGIIFYSERDLMQHNRMIRSNSSAYNAATTPQAPPAQKGPTQPVVMGSGCSLVRGTNLPPPLPLNTGKSSAPASPSGTALGGVWGAREKRADAAAQVQRGEKRVHYHEQTEALSAHGSKKLCGQTGLAGVS